MNVWVLTREINQYDQDGEYFECVFSSYPNEQQLMKAGVSQDNAEYLANGGNGRIKTQDEWWNLTEVPVYEN